MHPIFRAAFSGALILAPVAASAQMVIGEPPLMAEEEMMVEPLPMGGPLDEQGAAMIAMANGVATVEDVDHRFWDGNFEVEGADMTGEDIEILIDGSTGAVLEIDD